MNLKNWSKRILICYRHLPKIVKSIDKIFYSRAINAGLMSGPSITYNNVYNVTENLLALTERKITLINLKLLCDEILLSLPKDLAKVLILRYMDNLSYENIAKVCNISSRTVYRKVKKALEEASNILLINGYDENKLKAKLNSEKWIFELEEDVNRKEGFVLDNTYINAICKRYANFCLRQQVQSSNS